MAKRRTMARRSKESLVKREFLPPEKPKALLSDLSSSINEYTLPLLSQCFN
jgi:hypothetical protein